MNKDVFSKTVHSIRLKYSSVGVLFLALAVTLFRLGGPKSFGWYDFFAILVLLLMVLTLFLLQCHFVLSPIERMTELLGSLADTKHESADPVRLPWSGTDEFACLAAAINSMLESVQRQGVVALEENLQLKNVIAGAEVELVTMSRTGSVLNIIHCPDKMVPVPGLVCGRTPDHAVWGEANLKALQAALARACSTNERQMVEILFKADSVNAARKLKLFISLPKGSSFPIAVFRDEVVSESEPEDSPFERRVALSRVAAGLADNLRRAGVSLPILENLEILGGEKRMVLRRMSVSDLIADIRAREPELIKASGVRVNYNIPTDLVPVFADRAMVGKALENIILNAVEAFGSVPGVITIAARAHEMVDDVGAAFMPKLSAGPGIIISVSDDGPGIPEQILAHAFEPYCTTKTAGRGLGLAIADSIISAHGGGMRIQSVKSVSTCVEIFLRCSKRAQDEEDILRREFPGGEVLVVDDNRSVLRITAALLRTQKIAAHVADCKADALRKFSELSGRLKAVFLDAQLGDERSAGLLQNLRDIDEKVPIVVVSGYTRQEVDAMFSGTAFDEFLMKPYTVSELRLVLDRISIS